ncbi:hypothetical protein IG631_02947 [Alternaria alternata]|nr:hypothetical protein IG631_02947 [Alternaria alternata]
MMGMVFVGFLLTLTVTTGNKVRRLHRRPPRMWCAGGAFEGQSLPCNCRVSSGRPKMSQSVSPNIGTYSYILKLPSRRPAPIYLGVMAVIAIVEADYNQCAVLERFLGSTFPKGGASVKASSSTIEKSDAAKQHKKGLA